MKGSHPGLRPKLKGQQDARVREPGLLLVHTMIERGGKCALRSNALQPI